MGGVMFRFMSLFRFLTVCFGVIAILSISATPAIAAEKPEIFVQLGHLDFSGVGSKAVLSHTGKYLSSAGNSSAIKPWEVETDRVIKTLPADSIGIIEPEEYEVYIAVFAAGKLDGIPFGYVVIEKETLEEKMRKDGWKDVDAFMIDDFNRKNEKEYLLENKFLSDSSNLHITVRTEKNKGDIISAFDKGATSVSRVGFSKDKTKALVYVQHVASPEMGVGHYVTLHKVNGKWTITSSGIGKIF